MNRESTKFAISIFRSKTDDFGDPNRSINRKNSNISFTVAIRPPPNRQIASAIAHVFCYKFRPKWPAGTWEWLQNKI